MNRDYQSNNLKRDYKILFLHHSTGKVIYNAGQEPNIIMRKLFPHKAYVPQWFSEFNKKNGTNYHISEQYFPKNTPYGWNNYPFDYYNIWVKNAGLKKYMEEPTLEMLTEIYDLIIFKHCYPVSNISKDNRNSDINSTEKRLENYKLQYLALKQKLNEFPHTKFLIWTGAAQVKARITEEEALNAKAFFEWVKNDWITNNDNIYLWDFYELETEGTLYFKKEYAKSINDSHPGKIFAQRVAPLFCERIIEVINNK